MKTPTVLQMEAAECGAAALAIILAHYRRFVPLAEVRRECGVSRDGSRASNIVSAARFYGLEAKGYMATPDRLSAFGFPLIVFWNFNHFVVVDGFARGSVYLNDPATGPRTVSTEEFRDGFTGVVLALKPGPAFRPGGARPRVWPALASRLHGSVGALLCCIFLGFLLVLPGIAIPAFTQIFVDHVLVERMDDWLRPLLLGIVITAAFQAVFLRLQLIYLRRLRTKLAVTTSSRFIWHILRLPIAFYSQRFAGEISSRTVLNDRVAGLLSGRMATTAIDVSMMVFYAAVMFVYDRRLASVGVAAATVNFAALKWIARRRIDANVRFVQEQGKGFGLSIAALQNMEMLKASALESAFFERWAGVHARTMNAQQELNLVTVRLGFVPSLATQLATALVLVLGALRVMDGVLTIGMLVAFQSLLQSFLTPVTNLVTLGTTLQDVRADLNRLDDVLQNPTDPEADRSDVPDPAGPTAGRLRGHIEMRNVTFGYNRTEAPLVAGFNLTVRPGERVAIVGPSGSGKSTILRLLCGLYEPWEGEILFDGVPRRHIPRQVLTHSMAMLEQDIFLFEGSVRDNLTLWDATVPGDRLVQACRDAEIHDFILSIPGGYDGRLQEGAANISGGQRQRLEIARALVNDPSSIVADEATSALDGQTEERIDRNLRRRGCTCVIAAHRLSTIRSCEEIVVLHRGKVVQRGTHALLRHMPGTYAGLLLAEDEALLET